MSSPYMHVPVSKSNVLVLINFSEQDAHLTVPLEPGQWQEQLIPDSEEMLSIEQNGEYEIFLPANYGKIFAKV